VQEAVKRCEQKVASYMAYDDLLCAARDFVHNMSVELAAYSDTSGDLPSVSARLQCITEFATTKLPEGQAKVEACVNAAAVVSRDFGNSGQQSFLSSIDDLQNTWHQLEEHLNNVQQSLADAVRQWTMYNEHRHTVDEWMRNMEMSVKKEVIISGIDEIRPLIKLYQVKLH